MSKFTPVTAEQIERFFEGHCTPEEADAVSKYLQAHPDVLQVHIQQDWKEAGSGMALPKGYSEEMFEAIKAEVRDGSTVKRGRMIMMRRVTMGVAAAVVLLAVGAWLLWPVEQSETAKGTPKQIAAKQAAEKPSQPAQAQQRIIRSEKDETLRLPDGSSVVLYANSTLKYPEPFESKSRSLILEGKALFTVAKDERRPFIVTTGAIETTVLGTEFSVTTAGHDIIVRLYSGKIRLHAADEKWRKDIVLAPGEQLEYAKTSATAVVTNWNREEQEEEAEEMPEPTLDQQLVFDNEPLPQVLDRLAEGYHRTVSYNKQQIGNVYFTGTVQTSDSLTTILHVIATMNDLTIIPRKRGYSIRK